MSMGDISLGDRIRQKFDSGALPRDHSQRPPVAMASVTSAMAVVNPMRRAQGVFEFDVTGQTYRLHTGCYGLWEGELIRRGLLKPQ
jgi:hypothetical protein